MGRWRLADSAEKLGGFVGRPTANQVKKAAKVTTRQEVVSGRGSGGGEMTVCAALCTLHTLRALTVALQLSAKRSSLGSGWGCHDLGLALSTG